MRGKKKSKAKSKSRVFGFGSVCSQRPKTEAECTLYEQLGLYNCYLKSNGCSTRTDGQPRTSPYYKKGTGPSNFTGTHGIMGPSAPPLPPRVYTAPSAPPPVYGTPLPTRIFRAPPPPVYTPPPPPPPTPPLEVASSLASASVVEVLDVLVLFF